MIEEIFIIEIASALIVIFLFWVWFRTRRIIKKTEVLYSKIEVLDRLMCAFLKSNVNSSDKAKSFFQSCAELDNDQFNAMKVKIDEQKKLYGEVIQIEKEDGKRTSQN